MAQSEFSQNSVANFVQKAYQIISNEEYKNIIEWSMNGKQFIIKDIQNFEGTILPLYFRHRNIHSFIRQLNMYGFHKSRKQPTKNIFSHPNFQKNKKQLLHQVRRKLKVDESEIPQKFENKENVQAVQKTQIKILFQINQMNAKKEIEHQNKQVKIQKSFTQQPISSYCSILTKSINNLEKQVQISPLKCLLLSKSFIMESNPQVCLRLRDNNSFIAQQQQQDDNLSIQDEINRERQRFNNRTQGISIVKTSNFLDQFQF